MRNEMSLATQTREFYRSVAHITEAKVNQMGLLNAVFYVGKFGL
jgi:hypothetical protein